MAAGTGQRPGEEVAALKTAAARALARVKEEARRDRLHPELRPRPEHGHPGIPGRAAERQPERDVFRRERPRRRLVPLIPQLPPRQDHLPADLQLGLAGAEKEEAIIPAHLNKKAALPGGTELARPRAVVGRARHS